MLLFGVLGWHVAVCGGLFCFCFFCGVSGPIVCHNESISVCVFSPDQRWEHHCQMKVESMVLESWALWARASKSCLIKADFSCSSWAMRSLFSVTSCGKQEEVSPSPRTKIRPQPGYFCLHVILRMRSDLSEEAILLLQPLNGLWRSCRLGADRQVGGLSPTRRKWLLRHKERKKEGGKIQT